MTGTTSGKRLWDKSGDSASSLNKLIHEFTVGSDPEIDLNIIYWDILASAAHAKMLNNSKLLDDKDLAVLIPGLKKALNLVKKDEFTIPRELEDCHTALESYLTEECGDAGKRIHTGRSRNDQVLVAVRLYLRALIIDSVNGLTAVANLAFKRAESSLGIQIPGHTHFQHAMPASVGMWFSAIAEGAIELIREGLALSELVSINPLGVGSGFGAPLPIDRELTTKLLGFSKTQRNPINTQNSRGKYELSIVRYLSNISSWIEKYSYDLIIYNMQELRWVKIPKSFTTGSSIMPQKQNPDVLELLRGSASRVRASEFEIASIISKLPSHYHRDFQLTKEPLVKARNISLSTLSIFKQVLEGIDFDIIELEKSKSEELYVTYQAFRLVRQGMSFRDAYIETARLYTEGSINKKDLEQDFALIESSLISELASGKAELLQISNTISTKSAELNSLENLLS